MPNQQPKRAVVYIRVGRTKRLQESIARQRAACRAMADRSGITIECDYADGNASGKTQHRMMLQKLIWRVSTGHINCVIAATEASLSTDADDFIGLVTRFAGYGTMVGLTEEHSFIDVGSLDVEAPAEVGLAHMGSGRNGTAE